MRELYIITLCCAIGISTANAHQRFVSKRNVTKTTTSLKASAKKSDSGRLKVIAKSSDVWRPASQTEYYYNGESWDEMGTVYFKYDNRGNTVEERYEEDGIENITVRTFDQNNMVTSILVSEKEDETSTDKEKRTYTYDPTVTDFCTLRMGYDWNGSDWEKNHYCDKNEITRNSDNKISQIVKSMILGEDFIPGYKSEWKYDPATGQANEFTYYVNYNRNNTLKWEVDENLTYKDIVWENTNGQMTDHINELIEGDNRVKQYSVYYDGELDGHVFVYYSTDYPGDYRLISTYADRTEIGFTHSVATFDDNGSKRITDTEYFDENQNLTTTPTYQSIETVMMDSHGNIISDEIKEAYDGGTPELTMGQKYDIKYDANYNITEITTSIYDYEGDTYIPDNRIVYGEYSNVSSGINDIFADENAPVEYFNLQGLKVQNPENGLYIRRQGNSVSKIYVK